MTIEQSVILPCLPDAAFSLFTGEISTWWPPEHRLTKDPSSVLFLEETGRFFERASDGREVELGRVRCWERPVRLVLDFYLGTGPDRPTEVSVRFVPCQGGTRVSIEHKAASSTQSVWETRSPVFERNWTAVLASLRRRAETV